MIRSLPVTIGLRYFLSGGRSRLVSFISMLALLGMALGVALLILVLSVMNGFDREMRERILSVVPHMQIVGSMAADDWQSQLEAISQQPQVREVTPFTRVKGIVFAQDNTRPIEILGLSETLLPSGISTALKDSGVNFPKQGQLLLAEPIAKSLSISVGEVVNLIVPSDSLRQTLVVPMTLSGVFITHTEVDQMLGLATMAQVASIAGTPDVIEGYQVQVTDVFEVRSIARNILKQLPYGYGYRDWMQSHGNLYQAIQLSRNLVGLLIFLIVGIAAFNVVSMLMMTVIDKRKDIAVLQSMGLCRRQIVQLFLVQGSLIAILGTSLGILLGVLGCYWVADLIAVIESILGANFLDTAVYPIDYIPVDLRYSDIILVSVVAVLLTLVATIYPAIRASRTLPAEELRYE